MKFAPLFFFLWVAFCVVLCMLVVAAAENEKSSEDVEEILAEEPTKEEKAKKAAAAAAATAAKKEGAKQEAKPTATNQGEKPTATNQGAKPTATNQEAKPTATNQATKKETVTKEEGAKKTETPAKEEVTKKEAPGAGDGAKKETPSTGPAGTTKETPSSSTSEGAKEGTTTTTTEGGATAGEGKGTGSDVEAKGDGSESKGEVGEVEPPKEPEEPHEAPSGIRDPRPCEVCKYLAVELQGRLQETAKKKEYIETGHGIMPGDRKRKDYSKSELRLIEAVNEPHVCDRILGYDIHAERKRSLRYAKGHSETRRTLHGLVNKGVKVDLGIPYEIWKHNAPPNEITHLQRLCIELVEQHEDDLEEWYWGFQEQSLLDFLCRDRYLKNKDIECLSEEFKPEEEKEETQEEEKPKEAEKQDDSTKKGDTGKQSNEKPFVPPSLSSADPKAKKSKQSASKEEL